MKYLESITLSPASHWILDQYLTMIQKLDENTQTFELAHAVDALYTFLWDNYADWYVEYLKSDTSQIPFAKALYKEFIISASPFIPFEAEVLWKEYFGETTLLAHHVQSPEFVDTFRSQVDSNKVGEFNNIISFVSSIRSTRGLFAIDPAVALEIQSDSQLLNEYSEFINKAAKVSVTPGLDSSQYSVTLGDITYSIDIASFIEDTAKEITRTNKIIESLEKQKNSLEKQLGNEKFLEKAGEEVVAEKRDQLALRTQEIAEQQSKLKLLG